MKTWVQALAERICATLPNTVQELGDETKHHVAGVVRDVCDQLDIVTTEEFRAQASLLARCQTQLQSLEQEIEVLKAQRLEGRD